MAGMVLAHTARIISQSQSFAVASLGKGLPSLRRRAAASSTDHPVEPPNLTQLCEKARIHLTPEEIVDFTPKIASVVDWFSQLQDIDVENVAPAVRIVEVDEENNLRADVPVVFQEGEAMLAATPEREGPYLKVPKILADNVD